MLETVGQGASESNARRPGIPCFWHGLINQTSPCADLQKAWFPGLFAMFLPTPPRILRTDAPTGLPPGGQKPRRAALRRAQPAPPARR